MPVSPQLDSEGPVRVTILSNGAAVADSVQLISVRVQRSANTIPSARLLVEDGDMAASDWPVANAATFVPGAAITIKAGYGDEEETIFEGIVVKLGMKIATANVSRLVVDCQDKAVAMTVGRKNANYVQQTDDAVIRKLAGAHGLSIEVDATNTTYQELVQYYCTDWDYLLARAEANGLLVIATDGKLSVKAPQVSGAAVLKVTYGADLIEFQAEMDSRTQFASVEAVAWDPKTQDIVRGSAATPPTLNAQGNITSATLAQVLGLATLTIQTATPLEAASLTEWAKARQVKAGLARIRGRMRFQGSAKAAVGELIELEGVGERFNGKVFVGGLEHEIADGNWTTEAEFGLSPDWFTERTDIVAPPAAGWLPGAEGLQVGVVMKLDGDPLGEQRIQVKVPVLDAETPGVWARLAQFYASSAFGAFFLPEVGDEVILGYFNNDPSHPVILGSLYSSKNQPAYAIEAENNVKALVTRCLAKIEIREDDKSITITTPANNKIVLSDKDKTILVQDETLNKVTLSPSGISLESPKDITISAKGSMQLDAVGPVSIASKADVTMTGMNVTCEGQVAFTGKGAASAELSAAGQTTVKGAMVMIN
ncbi:type VI secretion system tip protein VgrG [Phenylobacterium sp.]|uniref:type VI secretion system tip protein VgrG n=1 Tax=Phenylobacterium sp. TaxID=1871053 RepID=UPI0025E86314|nr:type VI secretion system tip protein VgrG [Phenylobacterium sp.]